MEQTVTSFAKTKYQHSTVQVLHEKSYLSKNKSINQPQRNISCGFQGELSV